MIKRSLIVYTDINFSFGNLNITKKGPSYKLLSYLAIPILFINCLFMTPSIALSETGEEKPNSDIAQFINELGTYIINEVSNSSENITVSPFSIGSALAMTRAGARGLTLNEFNSSLNLTHVSDEELATGIAVISKSLEEASERSLQVERFSNEKPSKTFEWRLANRLFGETNYVFRESFLELMRSGYSSPLEKLDFKNNPQHAREHINKWVENLTEKRIVDLLPDNSITSQTNLTLVNALYLKAAWLNKFEKHLTSSEPFYLKNGESITAPTMALRSKLKYYKEKDRIAVTLPYSTKDLTFTVIIPAKGEDTQTVLKDLNRGLINQIDSAQKVDIRLSLPKFKLSSPSISLREKLIKKGIKSAFDIPSRTADFSGIGPRLPDDYLYISDVFHKTFFEIDENGTEAAAATAVVIARMSGIMQPVEPLEVKIDRSFLFYIKEENSGALLFIGKIDNPTLN